MIITFNEYLDVKQEENKSKLESLFDSVKKNKKLEVESHLNHSKNPFVFIKIIENSETAQQFKDLDLGIKIFGIGSKLVYRLNHGPHGIPIGPSQILEDKEKITSNIEKGKSEEEAYQELFESVPHELMEFMEKIYRNIEKQLDGSVTGKPGSMDVEKQRAILNSIVSSLFQNV